MLGLRPPPLVLLQGMPRSGTTWTGRTLAAGSGFLLVPEPLNPKLHPDRAHLPWRHATAEAPEAELVAIFQASQRRRWKRVLRPRGILVKEVHAIPATACLWSALRPRMAFITRHPCAVAASWARLGYDTTGTIDRLLAQPSLVEAHLAPHECHMRSREDVHFRVGALWGALHRIALDTARGHEDWAWVRHEDLCADPPAAFRALAARLGIRFGPAGDRFLREHDRPRAQDEHAYVPAREAAAQPGKWKDELSAAEVKSVLDGAEPFGVLGELYPDA